MISTFAVPVSLQASCNCHDHVHLWGQKKKKLFNFWCMSSLECTLLLPNFVLSFLQKVLWVRGFAPVLFRQRPGGLVRSVQTGPSMHFIRRECLWGHSRYVSSISFQNLEHSCPSCCLTLGCELVDLQWNCTLGLTLWFFSRVLPDSWTSHFVCVSEFSGVVEDKQVFSLKFSLRELTICPVFIVCCVLPTPPQALHCQRSQCRRLGCVGQLQWLYSRCTLLYVCIHWCFMNVPT